MRIYKHAVSGYWYHQFRGKRQSLKTKDKAVAKLAAADRERRAADPTYRAANETSLAEALTNFYKRQVQREKSPGTLKMHALHIRHLARVLGKDTFLVHIDANAVDHYMDTRTEEGAKKTTLAKELSTLRGTLRLAVRKKQFHQPLEAVMPYGFEVEYVPLTANLTLHEFSKLLSELAPFRAAVCCFIVATAADWKCVHVAQRSDVRPGYTSVLVRGSKNRHRWRTIPVLKPFRPLLEFAVKNMPFLPWSNVRRDLAVACRRAGVPKITPRDLRRSSASILRQMGIEPHLISKVLGHVDSRMVERIYGQLPIDAFGKIMQERLDAVLPTPDPKPNYSAYTKIGNNSQNQKSA